jgi:lipoprotein-releasing system permease protein
MAFEFFVGWRYLYAPRRSLALWILLGLSVAAIAAGTAFFLGGQWQAAAAITLLAGTVGLAFATMLMVFSTFTAISVMGVSIGVAVLIWVLSVTSGFQQEFRRKVLGVNAHILVLKYGLDFAEYPEVMRTAEQTPGVVAAAPFVFHQMMLARGNRLSGVLVKGVDPQRVGRVLDVPRHIQEPREGGRPARIQSLLTSAIDAKGRPTGQSTGIIIGRELAKKLEANVGDSVRLISPLSTLDPAGWAPGELPQSRDFRISGIFYSGFDEYDKRLVYVHLRAAQGFFDQGDVVTGVEMKVSDVFAAPRMARRLAKSLGGPPYRTVDWSELNQNLFTALNTQKLFLEIVIGFIVVVAAFNVLAALAVLVIRKTREIAILKSLGTTSTGVARVFQSAGLLIWLVGTSLGLGWGYLGGALLLRYGFPLDPKVYLISRLPVRMAPLEFVLTAAFALVVCFLATLYPAIRAARMNPVEGLRY